MKITKLEMAKAALFVLAVSAMGSQSYAEPVLNVEAPISSANSGFSRLATHEPSTEDHLYACYEKYANVNRNHQCRVNLQTQEGYKRDPNFLSCIKQLQTQCEQAGPGHG